MVGKFSGDKSPHWKGGRRIDHYGYVNIFSPNHPFRRGNDYYPEHRLVMEKHLRRYLERKEEVHHINGTKTDNRIDNLEVLSKAEHAKKHMLERNKKRRGK